MQGVEQAAHVGRLGPLRRPPRAAAPRGGRARVERVVAVAGGLAAVARVPLRLHERRLQGLAREEGEEHVVEAPRVAVVRVDREVVRGGPEDVVERVLLRHVREDERGPELDLAAVGGVDGVVPQRARRRRRDDDDGERALRRALDDEEQLAALDEQRQEQGLADVRVGELLLDGPEPGAELGAARVPEEPDEPFHERRGPREDVRGVGRGLGREARQAREEGRLLAQAAPQRDVEDRVAPGEQTRRLEARALDVRVAKGRDDRRRVPGGPRLREELGEGELAAHGVDLGRVVLRDGREDLVARAEAPHRAVVEGLEVHARGPQQDPAGHHGLGPRREEIQAVGAQGEALVRRDALVAHESQRRRLHVGPDLALLDAPRGAARAPAAAAAHGDDDPLPAARLHARLRRVAERAERAHASRAVDERLALGHARAPPPAAALLAVDERRLEQAQPARRRRLLEEDVQRDRVVVDELARGPPALGVAARARGVAPVAAPRAAAVAAPRVPRVRALRHERGEVELHAVAGPDLERVAAVLEPPVGRVARRARRRGGRRRGLVRVLGVVVAGPRRRLGAERRRPVVALEEVVQVVAVAVVEAEVVGVLLRARLRLAPRRLGEVAAAPRLDELAARGPVVRAAPEVEEPARRAVVVAGRRAPPPPPRAALRRRVGLAEHVAAEAAVGLVVGARLRAVAVLARLVGGRPAAVAEELFFLVLRTAGIHVVAALLHRPRAPTRKAQAESSPRRACSSTLHGIPGSTYPHGAPRCRSRRHAPFSRAHCRART